MGGENSLFVVPELTCGKTPVVWRAQVTLARKATSWWSAMWSCSAPAHQEAGGGLAWRRAISLVAQIKGFVGKTRETVKRKALVGATARRV